MRAVRATGKGGLLVQLAYALGDCHVVVLGEPCDHLGVLVRLRSWRDRIETATARPELVRP